MTAGRYRVFSSIFLAFCVVVFVVNRAFDRDMPWWLLVPVGVLLVGGLAIDTRYQRQKAKREGRW